MGAKEKAKNLVFKYQNLVSTWDCYNDEPVEVKFRLEDMKKCALICIDEIIEALDCNQWQNSKIIDFYNEVKQEINKL